MFIVLKSPSFNPNSDFYTERQQVANDASHLLFPDDTRVGFQPFPLSARNTYYWTIDNGNDWKIEFYPDRPEIIGMIHRYYVRPKMYANAVKILGMYDGSHIIVNKKEAEELGPILFNQNVEVPGVRFISESRVVTVIDSLEPEKFYG